MEGAINTEKLKIYCFDYLGEKAYCHCESDILAMIDTEIHEMEDHGNPISFTISFVYMTASEYKELPDFNGY